MLSWFIIFVISVIAGIILYACDQPGHRRRKQNPEFPGPERRDDKTIVDFLDYPIFMSKRCKDCNIITRRRGCIDIDCEFKEHKVSEDRL